MQADKVCEADLVAFEELAAVKSRLEVVQGEYEAMNEYVQSLPGHDVAGGLGQQVNIRVVKAQRATLTATGRREGKATICRGVSISCSSRKWLWRIL